MLDLVDSYNRKFVYLRLSVTDRCNFKCVYCLPNGYEPKSIQSFNDLTELSCDEIRRLVTAFSTLGIWKVRLTGGEPTLRRDIVDIAKTISKVNGIKKVAITTNGYRLKQLAKPLSDAGVSSINISVDSLDEEGFKSITGTDRFSQVMDGVDQALSVGFETVKINSVLLRDDNDSELTRFIDWIRIRPVSVRFIELMRTGKNLEFFRKKHISGGEVQLELLKSGFKPVTRVDGDGPAVVFRHPDYLGSIGIIAPYSDGFCESCNRLRVSSRGGLRMCLFGEKDESLREYLNDDFRHDELVSKVRNLLIEKPVSHFLHEGNYGNTWNLAGIGG